MGTKPTPSEPVRVPTGGASVAGDLSVPKDAKALVVLAFASAGGRHRRDERELASELNGEGLATVLVDLLSPEEESIALTEARDAELDVLASRIEAVLDWARESEQVGALPLGILSESSTSPAALEAAARRPDDVKALVLRGGALDAPERRLDAVASPTLVLVGDRAMEDAAKEVVAKIRGEVRVERLVSKQPIADEPEPRGVIARASSAWLGAHLSP